MPCPKAPEASTDLHMPGERGKISKGTGPGNELHCAVEINIYPRQLLHETRRDGTLLELSTSSITDNYGEEGRALIEIVRLKSVNGASARQCYGDIFCKRRSTFGKHPPDQAIDTTSY